jgi:putative ABC transport system ATP-binding protein
MTGPEGFRFAADPLADPVFATAAAEPSNGPAAACRDVVKTYRTATESVTALDGVTLEIPRARVTVVVGPSGSGKSSLDIYVLWHTWTRDCSRYPGRPER